MFRPRTATRSSPGPDLDERLVLSEMGQREQSLLEAAQLPPGRA
ncbi:hypothetical protein [Streptomyces osmaniensis]